MDAQDPDYFLCRQDKKKLSGLSTQTKTEFTQNNKRIADGIIRKWQVKEPC